MFEVFDVVNQFSFKHSLEATPSSARIARVIESHGYVLVSARLFVLRMTRIRPSLQANVVE